MLKKVYYTLNLGMQIIGKVNEPVTYPLKKKTADRKFYFKD